MKKLLQFIFYKVYWFYEQRWPEEDGEDFAFPYLILWICWNLIFSIFLLYSIFGLKIFVLEGSEKFVLIIPGVIIFIIGWRKLMSNGGYKEWIKPELFEDTAYAGQWNNLLFWALFALPFILLILAVALK